MNRSAQAFYEARDFLLAHREDYDTAYRDFRWPELDEFNWALDWFDAIAPTRRGDRARAVDRRGGRLARRGWTFAELSRAVQPGRQLAARARASRAATGSS